MSRDPVEFARAYHSDARRIWVSRQHCACCGSIPCENHHVRTDGTSRKGPYTAIVPLCWRCHRRWHGPNGGRETLLKQTKRDYGGLLWHGERDVESWDELAALVEAGWQMHETGLAF